jgi:hypothetical protein
MHYITLHNYYLFNMTMAAGVKYRGNGSEQTEGLPHWFWLGLTKYAPPPPPTTLNPLIGTWGNFAWNYFIFY